MTTLSLRNVNVSLGGRPVLEDISFTLGDRALLAVVGGSGSGKSTLLRVIAGFEPIDSGTVHLGSTLLSSSVAHCAAHRRGIGYVAQDGALFPHLTARQNIRFGLPRSTERDLRVAEVAELTALDADLLDRYPHELSGGQQQRVALARALAPRPPLILLDEPFSALDTGLRAQARRAVIDTLRQTGTATILVTHDQEEALMFGDLVGVIADGRLEQFGMPKAVFDAPDTRAMADFLGDTVWLDVLPGTGRPGFVRTPIGEVPVRHDRSRAGSGPLTVMLRPSQLAMTAVTGEAPGNARILSLTATGQYTYATLRIPDSADLTVPVPTAVSATLALGACVTVHALGDGVVYDRSM